MGDDTTDTFFAPEGRRPIAIAERILTAVRGHSWTGNPADPTGPTAMPAPAGKLFESGKDAATGAA